MDKQMTRNKICFGLGTVGRDALYSLVSMNLLHYLTNVVIFREENVVLIGIVLTAFGIFDAIIDPLVGAIVDNTKTKWGKYKPWILIGMIGTGVLTVAMFHNIDMEEITHIILLAVTYLLFSIFFSLNDIAYWSLMPAISKDTKVRESVGSFSRICASVGMFAMVLLYPQVTNIFSGSGLDPRECYFIFAIITALVMWAFQSITLFGVREDRSYLEIEERTSLKELWRALIDNDQLMITAVSMALFMIGYCITTGFGLQYFEYAFKNVDMYNVFAAVLAVAQLTALATFSLFRKKFTRKQLYTGAMITVVASYLLFFFSFEITALVLIAGLGLFFAQAFIQLLMLLFLADAIEYGEWKLGKRHEAASFAVQPFINQFGGAISKGVISMTLTAAGISAILKKFEEDMAAKGITDSDILKVEKLPYVDQITDGGIWLMKASMMLLPLILILIGFIIYQKKFRIDEEFYDKIVSDLQERNSAKNEESRDEIHS